MPNICNYYVTLSSNDTCEFHHAWQKDKPEKIEEKPCELGNLKKAGVHTLRITGGEPFLREDLPHILKEAKRIGFQTELSTNGIKYLDKARLVDGLIDRLFITLDYPFAEGHDRSRGVDCFHHAIKAVELARDLRQRPIIKFTMTRDNVLYLPEMAELSARLRVHLYLSPVYDFHGTQGFEPATLGHIRYYARRRHVLLNYAAMEFVKDGGNRVILPRCQAKETTVTILPDGKRAGPCFFNQGGRQGKEDICSSCMRWPYMLPSFSKGFDRYFWLNLYSNLVFKRKGIKV